jgi:hypothetical protein
VASSRFLAHLAHRRLGEGSSSQSLLPVTDCQNSASMSARRSSSTSSAAVWITTSTDWGIL